MSSTGTVQSGTPTPSYTWRNHTLRTLYHKFLSIWWYFVTFRSTTTIYVISTLSVVVTHLVHERTSSYIPPYGNSYTVFHTTEWLVLQQMSFLFQLFIHTPSVSKHLYCTKTSTLCQNQSNKLTIINTQEPTINILQSISI